MKTLVLYAYYTNQMSYYDDWLDAFMFHDDFNAESVDVFKLVDPDSIRSTHKKIETYDLIILHHSMTADTIKYIQPYMSALKNRSGKLVVFVGNEVNLITIGMAPKIHLLRELRAEIIATQLLQEAGEWLYESCIDSRVLSLPHGLNTRFYQYNGQYSTREIDIGTRSSRYPLTIGDNERNDIIEFFRNSQESFRLDLGSVINSERFTRTEWKNFLSNCKSTLSTEAGTFYLERDDVTAQAIQRYLTSKSKSIILPKKGFLRDLYSRFIPAPIRKRVVSLIKNHVIEQDQLDTQAEFQEIYDKFFHQKSVAPVYSKVISSRHFDAIGTRTLHVMYPGRYNDILRPHEHYFELRRDHGNLEDLKSLLSNDRKLADMTSRIYDYVAKNHTHKHRLDMLLESV